MYSPRSAYFRSTWSLRTCNQQKQFFVMQQLWLLKWNGMRNFPVPVAWGVEKAAFDAIFTCFGKAKNSKICSIRKSRKHNSLYGFN
ncbi:hypothetical protein TNIN_364681 [Trichonephila inaurata madagascariensis]|uniref:Uncharacterized protein n=1 Tax=Trichonephila inaurata madagascariensis TaxID=2747483 RepID=A0A8X7BPX1_9ARAC|nr:hypothetical protein TNIN_364661 [Trichonephila inaurata madagascariensis]GFY40293.1 hypothetical protein TNIN_364681 [Trichonephila inaurata madagascariensis]